VFRILGPTFACLGGALWLAAAVLAGSRALFLHGAARATGRVIAERAAPDDTPRVEVSLPELGKSVVVRGMITTDPPALRLGEQVVVFYPPGQPAGARIGTFLELWFVPLLLGGLGTPFVLIGSGFLLASASRTRRRRELMAAGQKLLAEVVGVERSFVRINRRRASILVAAARQPGAQPQIFRSEALLVGTDHWLGKTVTVYVDARDPLRYFMELTPVDARGSREQA
jgi:hypothetical protein